MSPSRNELALAEILRELGLPTNNEEAVAEYLARRGVLVPAALSDDAVQWIAGRTPSDLIESEDAAWFRAELERLARGEAAA